MSSPMLIEATNEQARAKVGAFGRQGSGKTTTLALLALGVSKTYHNGAAVAFMDTENGSDYLKPIFDREGVKLLVAKSGAFADMVPVLRQAEQMGCCAFVMDSVTHTWNELKMSYAKAMAAKYNVPDYDLQFQDWDEIKRQWATWTTAFLNSPLHCFIAGRAGHEYEYEVNERGKKTLVKGDSKMKAETDFGYEPSLLVELEAERRKTTKKHTGGSFVHIARILKDRARSLNGKSFEFADLNDYNPGDYKKVFDAFLPHFAFLNIGGTQRAIGTNNSDGLFGSSGDTEYRFRAREKQIALDESAATMQLLWPGQAAADKALRIRVMETIWGVRAWSAVENMPLEAVQRGLEALRAYERDSKQAEGVDTEAGVLALLQKSLAGYHKEVISPVVSPVSHANGDGTLTMRKPTGGVNLPPIPPSQPLPIREEDKEIVYRRMNGSVILSGGTFAIKDTIKKIYGGSYHKAEKSWEIPANYFESLEGLCSKAGISLISANGAC